MKKLKIMLLSLALFAVVGGALAFKARYSNNYCTAPWSTGEICAQKTCETLVTRKTTLDGTGNFICTTTAPNQDCTYLNPQSEVKTITCFASTSIKNDF